VDATPGVTRDRISTVLPLGEGEEARFVELVDTGGMGIEDTDNLTDHVESQIDFALRAAALILFVVDARAGVTPLDKHVAGRLRREDKPVLLLANKVDEEELTLESGELHRLGFGEAIRTSAKHLIGRHELLEAIADHLGESAGAAAPSPELHLAIVGKRNAGKSTFINALAGAERVIVSETPGTTRDSVDVHVEFEGRPLVVIDTAGVRKTKSLAGDIEFYSHHRAMRSIRRADVVARMIDASLPVSQVDKKLASEIAGQFKPVLFVVNKWDLAEDKAEAEEFAVYLEEEFPEIRYAPLSLTKAIDGTNVRETIRVARQLFEQANARVSTGMVMTAVRETMKLRGPSHRRGTKPPKVFFASQVATAPPTIVLFVNDIRPFQGPYERFLMNQLRERLPFAEVPIRLIFRQRDRALPPR